MVIKLLTNFRSILDDFPDPVYGEAYTRDILHCFEQGQNLMGPAEPPTTFLDNLRFYDFVLHAEDVKKIFLDGEHNKQPIDLIRTLSSLYGGIFLRVK